MSVKTAVAPIFPSKNRSIPVPLMVFPNGQTTSAGKNTSMPVPVDIKAALQLQVEEIKKLVKGVDEKLAGNGSSPVPDFSIRKQDKDLLRSANQELGKMMVEAIRLLHYAEKNLLLYGADDLWVQFRHAFEEGKTRNDFYFQGPAFRGINLMILPNVILKIHLFPLNSNETDPHQHRKNFSSFMLAGGYKQTLYDVASVSENDGTTDGRSASQWLVRTKDGKGNLSTPSPFAVNDANGVPGPGYLKVELEHDHKTGLEYFIDACAIHSLEETSGPILTLVLQPTETENTKMQIFTKGFVKELDLPPDDRVSKPENFTSRGPLQSEEEIAQLQEGILETTARHHEWQSEDNKKVRAGNMPLSETHSDSVPVSEAIIQQDLMPVSLASKESQGDAQPESLTSRWRTRSESTRAPSSVRNMSCDFSQDLSSCSQELFPPGRSEVRGLCSSISMQGWSSPKTSPSSSTTEPRTVKSPIGFCPANNYYNGKTLGLVKERTRFENDFDVWMQENVFEIQEAKIATGKTSQCVTESSVSDRVWKTKMVEESKTILQGDLTFTFTANRNALMKLGALIRSPQNRAGVARVFRAVPSIITSCSSTRSSYHDGARKGKGKNINGKNAPLGGKDGTHGKNGTHSSQGKIDAQMPGEYRLFFSYNKGRLTLFSGYKEEDSEDEGEEREVFEAFNQNPHLQQHLAAGAENLKHQQKTQDMKKANTNELQLMRMRVRPPQMNCLQSQMKATHPSLHGSTRAPKTNNPFAGMDSSSDDSDDDVSESSCSGNTDSENTEQSKEESQCSGYKDSEPLKEFETFEGQTFALLFPCYKHLSGLRRCAILPRSKMDKDLKNLESAGRDSGDQIIVPWNMALRMELSDAETLCISIIDGKLTKTTPIVDYFEKSRGEVLKPYEADITQFWNVVHRVFAWLVATVREMGSDRIIKREEVLISRCRNSFLGYKVQFRDVSLSL